MKKNFIFFGLSITSLFTTTLFCMHRLGDRIDISSLPSRPDQPTLPHEHEDHHDPLDSSGLDGGTTRAGHSLDGHARTDIPSKPAPINTHVSDPAPVAEPVEPVNPINHAKADKVLATIDVATISGTKSTDGTALSPTQVKRKNDLAFAITETPQIIERLTQFLKNPLTGDEANYKDLIANKRLNENLLNTLIDDLNEIKKEALADKNEVQATQCDALLKKIDDFLLQVKIEPFTKAFEATKTAFQTKQTAFNNSLMRKPNQDFFLLDDALRGFFKDFDPKTIDAYVKNINNLKTFALQQGLTEQAQQCDDLLQEIQSFKKNINLAKEYQETFSNQKKISIFRNYNSVNINSIVTLFNKSLDLTLDKTFRLKMMQALMTRCDARTKDSFLSKNQRQSILILKKDLEALQNFYTNVDDAINNQKLTIETKKKKFQSAQANLEATIKANQKKGFLNSGFRWQRIKLENTMLKAAQKLVTQAQEKIGLTTKPINFNPKPQIQKRSS